MTYLLALLFFIGEQPDRAAAIEAAKARYAATVRIAEQEHLETAIKSCKTEIANVKRAIIDPSVPGRTARMKNRGDGVFVQGQIQFPTPESRHEASLAAAEQLRIAEENLRLWKLGLLHPEVVLPALNFDALTVGQVGRIESATVVSVIDGDRLMVRLPGRKANGRFELAEVSGQMTFGVNAGESKELSGPFWVSGKRVAGKQTVFVIEPLDVP